MLGDFFSQGVAQLNLFDENAPSAGSDKLMEVLDHLNAKDGKGTLNFAGQGIQQQWQMKREMLHRVIQQGSRICWGKDSHDIS
jgi:DNA polymerase V